MYVGFSLLSIFASQVIMHKYAFGVYITEYVSIRVLIVRRRGIGWKTY